MTTNEVFVKAMQDTLLGMGLVFLVLIFISWVISLFRFLPGGQGEGEAAKVDEAGLAPEQEEDGLLVAVIGAAIHAATAGGQGESENGEPGGDGYVVRTVRRM